MNVFSYNIFKKFRRPTVQRSRVKDDVRRLVSCVAATFAVPLIVTVVTAVVDIVTEAEENEVSLVQPKMGVRWAVAFREKSLTGLLLLTDQFQF